MLRLLHGAMESPSNPVQRVSKPKVNPRRERRLEESEEERLIAVVPFPLVRAIKFAVKTVMRRSEITKLFWNT